MHASVAAPPLLREPQHPPVHVRSSALAPRTRPSCSWQFRIKALQHNLTHHTVPAVIATLRSEPYAGHHV